MYIGTSSLLGRNLHGSLVNTANGAEAPGKEPTGGPGDRQMLAKGPWCWSRAGVCRYILAMKRILRPLRARREAPGMGFGQWTGLCTVALLLGACGDKGKEAEPKGDSEIPNPVASNEAPNGPALFVLHCALCHGADGGGKGLVKFDRPARSFVDGGFSFGNTPEALLRTVTHGIGGTPMPGFEKVLDEAQRKAVVRHVIDLGPERDPELKPGQTILTVADRALVIRGGLPPLADGLPGHARGM